MISAHTDSRIEVANKLYDMRTTILGIHGNVCLGDSERMKLDRIVEDMDSIINKVMGVGK